MSEIWIVQRNAGHYDAAEVFVERAYTQESDANECVRALTERLAVYRSKVKKHARYKDDPAYAALKLYATACGLDDPPYDDNDTFSAISVKFDEPLPIPTIKEPSP